MKRSSIRFLDKVIYGLTILFTLDRLLKIVAVINFFRRPQPPSPSSWPTVTLLQPITRGTSNLLQSSLRTRALLVYPATVQHLFICDAYDVSSLNIVSSFLAEFQHLQAEVLLVEPGFGTIGAIATKMKKLQMALPKASGDVLCFVDDDGALRPQSLGILLPYLFQPGVGVAFGFPCFTSWQTVWSSLISSFINAHMLLSFAALSYLTKPIRINGHFFAFREVFRDIGGLDDLEQYIDDEYTIAQRVRSHNLHTKQTPLIYDPEEKLLASLASVDLPMPGIITLLTPFTRRRSALWAMK